MSDWDWSFESRPIMTEARSDQYCLYFVTAVELDTLSCPAFVLEQKPGVVETVPATEINDQKVYLISDRASVWADQFFNFCISTN